MNTSLQCSEVLAGAGASAPAPEPSCSFISTELATRLCDMWMRDLRELSAAQDVLWKSNMVGAIGALELAKRVPRANISWLCADWFQPVSA